MKILFFSLLLFSSSAFAEYQWSAENPTYTQFQIHLAPDPRSTDTLPESDNAWTTGNTYREVAFQILNVIDWGQTRYVAEHPDRYQESEAAWIIGNHPTTGRVDTYMVESAAFHFVVAYSLPSNWRTAFQYITIGNKLNATIGNASIGIKVSL